MWKFIKQLFCEHKYEMVRWHWCHGMTGMEPRQIEAELKCDKCGKITYWHITDPDRFQGFIEQYASKQV